MAIKELVLLPKGEKIPQTVEYLQHVMAVDAELMLKMDKQIKRLEDQLIRKQAAVMKWKGKYYKQALESKPTEGRTPLEPKPDKMFWKGRDLDTLSREELVSVVRQQVYMARARAQEIERRNRFLEE